MYILGEKIVDKNSQKDYNNTDKKIRRIFNYEKEHS